MEKNQYKQIIQEASTLEDLKSIKDAFLSECTKREQRILVGNLLTQINSFGDAKSIFESVVSNLLKKEEGKNIIKKYIKVIKENESLKTMYALHEGLKDNSTPNTKKAYIVEALAIANPVNPKDYTNGLGDMVKVIAEAFNVLGDTFVLDNVSLDKTNSMISESLYYLSTTKKDLRNLNDYISHIAVVSENTTQNINNDINVDKTLTEIVTSLTNEGKSLSKILETEDRQTAFEKSKQVCLEMLDKQITSNNTQAVIAGLNEIKSKLSKKGYNYDSFTKDMIYMVELQDVLK